VVASAIYLAKKGINDRARRSERAALEARQRHADSSARSSGRLAARHVVLQPRADWRLVLDCGCGTRSVFTLGRVR
jgi:hypothetical protein